MASPESYCHALRFPATTKTWLRPDSSIRWAGWGSFRRSKKLPGFETSGTLGRRTGLRAFRRWLGPYVKTTTGRLRGAWRETPQFRPVPALTWEYRVGDTSWDP